MDRFDPNDVRYDYDTFEPIRTGSFDLTFAPNQVSSKDHIESENLKLHIVDGVPSYNLCASPKLKTASSFRYKNGQNGSSILRNSEMMGNLQKRALDAIPLNDLEHPLINWKLTKSVQDVKVHEISIPTPKMSEHLHFPAKALRCTNPKSTIGFRISCQVTSDVTSVMNCLSLTDSSKYNEMEGRISTGHLHAEIIKSLQTDRLPENHLSMPKAQNVNDLGPEIQVEPLPRLAVK
uniref:AlNc14C417G11496 protein n=1 Tax=Albugo laibachii Nc14 TaxID=890382 RepID=F0WZ90_9STRA|nr:AlNc14C417G11496 [Albugo laibachii Nc14]|eukprot:CCA26807.1 AlNc14C417G11496 [Albugo laibachii Nc14]